MRRLVVLALLASSCRGGSAARPGSIQIVAAPGERGAPFMMEFGANQDGTGAVINFLLRAQREGAHAASDLAIYVTGHDGERALTCRRDVQVGPAPAAPPPRDAYPRLVTREITDQVYECKNTPVPVTRTVTTWKPTYDPVTHQTINVPHSKTVTENVSQKDCKTVPRTATATRYEHEIEAGFAPPRLETLAPTYTRLELHLGAPSCEPASAGRPPHRIEGIVYGRR